jgi:hypothetical protein
MQGLLAWGIACCSSQEASKRPLAVHKLKVVAGIGLENVAFRYGSLDVESLGL